MFLAQVQASAIKLESSYKIQFFMTLAEAAHARFEELERAQHPAHLSKHLKDTVRLAVKTKILEDRIPKRGAPGWRVAEAEFSDGSRLRIEQTKKFGETYLWTGCRVL